MLCETWETPPVLRKYCEFERYLFQQSLLETGWSHINWRKLQNNEVWINWMIISILSYRVNLIIAQTIAYYSYWNTFSQSIPGSTNTYANQMTKDFVFQTSRLFSKMTKLVNIQFLHTYYFWNLNIFSSIKYYIYIYCSSCYCFISIKFSKLNIYFVTYYLYFELIYLLNERHAVRLIPNLTLLDKYWNI